MNWRDIHVKAGDAEAVRPDASYVESLATIRYHDRYFGCEAAKLLPGEYFATAEDLVIVTVLGSCVAACIRDPLLGIGGMNHFLLPHDGPDSRYGVSARYGTYAMEILINHLLKLGASRDRLEAKVFGGGAVLESIASSEVGEQNAEFVLDFLKTENIPVLAKDLLESYPRKVYFFPRSGRVMVKKLHRVHNDTLFVREQEYKLRLARSTVEGEMALFDEPPATGGGRKVSQ